MFSRRVLCKPPPRVHVFPPQRYRILPSRVYSTGVSPAGSTTKAQSSPSVALLAVSFAAGWAAYGTYAYTKRNRAKATAAASDKSPPTATTSSLSSVIPSLATEPFQPFEFSSPLTPEGVTARLNAVSWAVTETHTPGVPRYYGAQLATSDPCEDFYVHGKFPLAAPPSAPSSSSSSSSKPQEWLAWGVFDGHIGAETSRTLAKHLVPYVADHLSRTLQAGSATTATTETDIAQSIKTAFQQLDDVFVGTVPATLAAAAAASQTGTDLPFATAVSRLVQGSNGSCAILSLFDPASRALRVACTGDSRAVLGRRRHGNGAGTEATGEWEAVALSEDQSGSAAAEVARITAVHPGEDGLIADGRIIGLMCTRAFGDGRWKWARDVIADAKRRFSLDRYKPYDEKFQTPPYVTAEPEVTSVVVEKGVPSFMIIASDGLWDILTNEQAVTLVSKWVEWRDKGMPPPPAEKKTQDFGPFDLAIYKEQGWDFQDRKTTVQDANPAVHLIRNAIGGAHHDMVAGLLGYRPPYARFGRDDITVQVVFFE